MRILQTRFKNLNSLQGEWSIDFTDPAYVSDGIFAITGPTGSGKTTILDAICLALYGRTPRLKSITQSGNEIMSRRTGECFAEALFETNLAGGRKQYCVHWSQHRSYRKPDGQLQAPKHEVADAGTKKILASGLNDVAQTIEEVTGLTFDRFVRSMLLAQGDFATFLQSGPNDRSPILEQITGTEIYSQISMQAHEVRNAERAKLNALEAELAGRQTTSPEEKAELEAQLAAQTQDEAALEEALEQCGREIEWLEGMATLQKELNALEEQSKDLTRRQEVFEPERQRLEQAQRALEFGVAYAALATLRKAQDEEKRSLFSCQAKLPELEADVRRAEESLQLAAAALAERQTEQQNLLDLLRKVRELDIKESGKNPMIRDLQSAAEQLEDTRGKFQRKYEEDHARLEKARIEMRDLQKFLQSNAADERLIELLEGIKTRFESLRLALEKSASLAAACADAEKLKQQTQNEWSERNALYETAKAQLASEENSLRKLKGTLDELLRAAPLSEWREKLENLNERKLREGYLEESLARQSEILASLEKLRLRSATIETVRKNGDLQILEQQNKIQGMEREVQRLEDRMELMQRIRDLEEERRHLQEGGPCPLCGSTAHPYASSVPQEPEIGLPLRSAREDLRKAGDALSEMQIRNAQLDQEKVQVQEEGERLRTQLSTVETSLTEGFAMLQMKLPMDVAPMAGIARQRQKTEELLQKTRLTVERAEKIEHEIQLIRDNLEKARESLQELTRSLQEEEFRRESAGRDWARLIQDIRLHDEELKNIRQELVRQVTPFGFKHIPDERPEQIPEQLEARREKWQVRHNLRLELEKQIAAWERDLHHERDELDRLGLELKDKREAVKRLQADRDMLRQQRMSLFGDKNPDREEQARAAAVKTAQKLVEEKRGDCEIVRQEFANMHARMEELGKSIHIRTSALQKADIDFGKQLLAHNFRNEEGYLAACLPEAERRALQERVQTLSRERTELDARRTDRKFAMEELRRQALTTSSSLSSLEDLQKKRNEDASRHRELQQSIGALRMRLSDIENSSRLMQERLAAIERQRQETLRWERLHELIGSADGQKYRNFAQGLTFEMVIRHANRQLQKMTDRYLLSRDKEQALELKVIDSYQAGEIRSTKNLSGGEGFIVSLALALGLSQMSSHRVRVDSLFLDEGFGTLDEEALDMALSTLASLRREGKLIGVISHVDALKERIAVQVEVIPQGNGRSIIQAPGCTGKTEQIYYETQGGRARSPLGLSGPPETPGAPGRP